MSTKKILTIGMQTHNRVALAKKRIEAVYNRGLPDWVEFIVLAETESNDNTWEELTLLSEKYPFALYSGRGRGFSDAFMQVTFRSSGEYCMHLPDEDDFSVEALAGLRDFLSQNSPDIVVADYFISDENKVLQPYRVNITKVIRPAEFLECNHNPGIIWKVNSVKKFKHEWEAWRVNYKTIASYYPHTLLMVKILPDLSSWFYGEMVSFQVDSCNHQHIKHLGGNYNDLSPRWAQFKELDRFIKNEIGCYKSHKIQLELMLNAHNSALHSIIRNAIAHEFPDALSSFEISSRRSVILSRFLFYIVRPALLLKKIRIKLVLYLNKNGRNVF